MKIWRFNIARLVPSTDAVSVTGTIIICVVLATAAGCGLPTHTTRLDPARLATPRDPQDAAQATPPSAPATDGPAAPPPDESESDRAETDWTAAHAAPAPTPANDSEKDVKHKQPRQSLDEKLLFYPAKYPEGDWQPTEIQYDDAWFDTEDGLRLHGWYCPCARPRAVVLYAHGNAGNLAHRVGVLQILQQQLHCTVLIFDYRGYGRSVGKPTVKGILLDARAARAELARRAHVKSSAVVLMGRSLGGAVMVQLAAGAAPRGLVLESTFSSFRDVAKVHFPFLAWAVPARKLNSVEAINGCHCPLLQSHGDADRTVPFALGRKLFQAAHEPKQWVTIPGGNHNSPQTRAYYVKLDQFLASLP